MHFLNKRPLTNDSPNQIEREYRRVVPIARHHSPYRDPLRGREFREHRLFRFLSYRYISDARFKHGADRIDGGRSGPVETCTF